MIDSSYDCTVGKIALEKKEKIWLMLLGIPFSFLGSTLLLKFGGNFYPEPFLLLWIVFSYFFFKQRFIEVSSFIYNPILFCSIFLILLMVSTIGLYRWDADVFDYYARLRAFLIFSIAVYIGYYAQSSRNYELYLELLFWLCAGSVLLNFVYILLANFTNIYSYLTSAKNTFAVLANIIAITLLLRKGNLNIAFIFVLILIISAGLSFFRQFYFVALLATLYFLCYALWLSKVALSRKVLLVTLVVILLSLALIFSAQISEVLMLFFSSSESRYIHSIGKLNDLLSMLQGGGGSTSENVRAESLEYMLSNINYYLLPNGLINSSSFYIYSIWGGEPYYIEGVTITNDSVFAYVVVLFGALIVMLFFMVGLFLAVNGLSRAVLEEKMSILFYFILFWFLFFIDGSLIGQFEKALFTGAIVTLAFPMSVMTQKR